MTRIGIVGTRKDDARIARAVRDYIGSVVGPDVVVVTGCASGVDTIAWQCAISYGMVVVRCHAPWIVWRSAGPRRNAVLVGMVDELHAFPDVDSIGTWDAVRKARVLGVPVTVHRGGGGE